MMTILGYIFLGLVVLCVLALACAIAGVWLIGRFGNNDYMPGFWDYYSAKEKEHEHTWREYRPEDTTASPPKT